MPLQYITCPQCGYGFTRTNKHPDQRFCSRPCARRWNALQARLASIRPCEHCGIDFTPGHPGSRQRYCSRKCSSIASHPAQGHGTAICKQCGVVFVRNFADHVFCSKSCSGLQNTHKRSFVSRETYFADRVQKTDNCWIWIGKRHTKGYGIATYRGQSMLAHRFSYELHYPSSTTADLNVCHTCDNPRCVRPDHLFLGTQTDNMADMYAKARHAHGSRTPNAKLTDADVRDIRSSKEINATLARYYGVTSGTISNIRRHKTWCHVK